MLFKLIRVSGESLLPEYRSGDFVIVSKIPLFFTPLKKGDMIVLKHRLYGTLIKKVEALAPEKDEIFVIGTHENSLDSRHFGAISKKDLVGKVIGHIPKP